MTSSQEMLQGHCTNSSVAHLQLAHSYPVILNDHQRFYFSSERNVRCRRSDSLIARFVAGSGRVIDIWSFTADLCKCSVISWSV